MPNPPCPWGPHKCPGGTNVHKDGCPVPGLRGSQEGGTVGVLPGELRWVSLWEGGLQDLCHPPLSLTHLVICLCHMDTSHHPCQVLPEASWPSFAMDSSWTLYKLLSASQRLHLGTITPVLPPHRVVSYLSKVTKVKMLWKSLHAILLPGIKTVIHIDSPQSPCGPREVGSTEGIYELIRL